MESKGMINFIPVPVAARKLMLSQKCVNALCEHKLLADCTKICGEWFIPGTCKRPDRQELENLKEMCGIDCDKEQLVTQDKVIELLKITLDTCRNWIRLGKLKPDFTNAGEAYFTEEYLSEFKKNLRSGSGTPLKSRRNKKYVTGNSIYRAYVSDDCVNAGKINRIISLISMQDIKLDSSTSNFLIAECAIALFTDRLKLKTQKRRSFLEQYLKGEINLGKHARLIDPLISDRPRALKFCKDYEVLLDFDYVYEPREDVLGLIYISCRCLGERKSEGIYYTPTKVVRDLISELDIKPGKTILDPCCGTGNFLMQLPDEITFTDIYGNDLDENSALIARINLALRFPEVATEDICKHITVRNFLTQTITPVAADNASNVNNANNEDKDIGNKAAEDTDYDEEDEDIDIEDDFPGADFVMGMDLPKDRDLFRRKAVPAARSAGSSLPAGVMGMGVPQDFAGAHHAHHRGVPPQNFVLGRRLPSEIELDSKEDTVVETPKPHHDTPATSPKTSFDYIIGNPPWGFDFSKKEVSELKKLYSVANSRNVESYDVFIEKAMGTLTHKGRLAFVLPEAILNVKIHAPIRSFMQERSSITRLDYLGEVFDGVQCPCVIMQLRYDNKPLSTKGMEVRTKHESYTINTERHISPECFSFTVRDDDYGILSVLREHACRIYLKNNADFALGIVTGNNKQYLSSTKTDNNEVILRGSDIVKYRIKDVDNYIVFEPEKFQQVADEHLYRAPERLLYRFISNQLVFAYDNNGTLSLNSCNIVIPHAIGVSTKYILAVLNSRMSQFIFQKEFNSVKVLRSHIENLPIPDVLREEQKQIEELVDKLIDGAKLDKGEAIVIYDKIDGILAEHFALTPAQYEHIKSVVGNVTKNLA